ncbi:glycosyltransferase family 4 protein, partial [Salmonella enterica]|nr:glycosyltransferase family 4 protein [Salmonella enterica]HAB2007092.1 glycosyltransferase [Salmonella enterica subsp. diarizonae]
MKRLCYFVNSDWYFDLHWIERAIAARDAGYEIHIISHFISEEIIKKFKTLGFICHNVSLVAQSFNVFVFFRGFFNARKIIKEINPDLLHCITLKPCLIGGFSARRRNSPVVISFVGLGRIFLYNTLLMRTLRVLTVLVYKYIAGNKRGVFIFEHDRDRRKISRLVGIDYHKTIVIEGAGINPNIYKFSIEKKYKIPIVLFASRMLWSKGLGDLIEAKKILRQKNIHFILNVAGILAEGDKDAIPLELIHHWHNEGLINWLGRSSNVYELIQKSNIVALPSVYPEGIPRLLLEASSVGRACIAYDTGGCDSLIIHNYNGLIVKSNSAQELAVELEYLLKNPQIRLEMGMNGRKRVKE